MALTVVQRKDREVLKAIRASEKRLRSFKQFVRTLVPRDLEGLDVFGDVFRSMVQKGPVFVSEKKTLMFLQEVYAIMGQMVADENQLNAARQAKTVFTAARLRFSNSIANVKNSLTYLNRAETAVRPDLADLVRGTVDFAAPRKALETLKKALEEVEGDSAAMVHPDFRKNSPELQQAARRSKLMPKAWKLKYPVTPGSAATEHHAIVLLEKAIIKFTRGRASALAINRMIAKVFLAAADRYIEPETVKTILARQKKNQTSLSPDGSASGQLMSRP